RLPLSFRVFCERVGILTSQSTVRTSPWHRLLVPADQQAGALALPCPLHRACAPPQTRPRRCFPSHRSRRRSSQPDRLSKQTPPPPSPHSPSTSAMTRHSARW